MSESDSELVVPVDDGALNLLEDAVNFYWVHVDEEGNHFGSGEFDLHGLLQFWSGYDPEKEFPEGEGTIYLGGPLLTSKDVILALITEIRRLRNEVHP